MRLLKRRAKLLRTAKWPKISPHQRARYLLAIADLIEKHADELAILETLNNGMAISTARGLLPSAIDTFRYYAGWATKICGETNPSEPSMFNYTLCEPVGVCGQILERAKHDAGMENRAGPGLRKRIDSEARGINSTYRTQNWRADIGGGYPDGVVNIITGYGETADAAIASHPDIDKVAFPLVCLICLKN